MEHDNCDHHRIQAAWRTRQMAQGIGVHHEGCQRLEPVGELASAVPSDGSSPERATSQSCSSVIPSTSTSGSSTSPEKDLSPSSGHCLQLNESSCAARGVAKLSSTSDDASAATSWLVGLRWDMTPMPKVATSVARLEVAATQAGLLMARDTASAAAAGSDNAFGAPAMHVSKVLALAPSTKRLVGTTCNLMSFTCFEVMRTSPGQQITFHVETIPCLTANTRASQA
jgi:hypothetical protein